MAGVEREGKGKKKSAKRVSVRERVPSCSPTETLALLLTFSVPFYGLPRRLHMKLFEFIKVCMDYYSIGMFFCFFFSTDIYIYTYIYYTITFFLYHFLTCLKLILDAPTDHHCIRGALVVGDPWVQEVVNNKGGKVNFRVPGKKRR